MRRFVMIVAGLFALALGAGSFVTAQDATPGATPGATPMASPMASPGAGTPPAPSIAPAPRGRRPTGR